MDTLSRLVDVGGGSLLGLVAPVIAIWLILVAGRAASVMATRWWR